MLREGSAVGPALVIALLLSTGIRADTILVDNFDDGDDAGWTHMDFAEGTPWGPAIYDASSGSYHIESSGPVPADDPNVGTIIGTWEPSRGAPLFSNGFVRGKVRADAPGGTFGFILRADDVVHTDYGFYGSSTFGTFYIERFDGSQPVPQTIIAMGNPSDLAFGVGEDWFIEGGAVGDQLSLKAWRVGEAEPLAPQLLVTDPFFGPETGTLVCVIGFFDPAAVREPVTISGTFDDITFRAVPEPASVVSVATGLLVFGLVALRRRRDRASGGLPGHYHDDDV